MAFNFLNTIVFFIYKHVCKQRGVDSVWMGIKIEGPYMNRSTFQTIKYMNGSVFSKARYMNGVGFEILASTLVPQLPPSYSPRPPPTSHEEDSRSLIRVFTGHILDSQGCKVSSSGRGLIRLRGCACWFESSLGAYAKRYVLSFLLSSLSLSHWHVDLYKCQKKN